MPQFDQFSFFIQVFWFLLIFFSFYILISFYFLPMLNFNIKFRQKYNKSKNKNKKFLLFENNLKKINLNKLYNFFSINFEYSFKEINNKNIIKNQLIFKTFLNKKFQRSINIFMNNYFKYI